MQLQREFIGIDLCAGAGGMTLGFQQAGIDVVGAVEVAPRAACIHELNFPKCKVLQESIVGLDAQTLLDYLSIDQGSVDVVFGGPPCQGFSQIGRRRNDDTRNEVLLSFGNLATELQPSIIVAENVKGILMDWASEKREAYYRILKDAGYHVLEPWVLDASQFGVPQRRTRVFIVATRGTMPAPSMPVPLESTAPTVWDAIGDLSIAYDRPGSLREDFYEGPLPHPSQYGQSLRQRSRSNPSISCMKMPSHSATVRERFESTLPGKTEDISRLYRLSKQGLAPTLRAGTGPERGSFMACRPIHPTQPRCITVREAARLHGFPDSFRFDPEHWHGFQQIGNSVPPPLAKSVALTIISTLKSYTNAY